MRKGCLGFSPFLRRDLGVFLREAWRPEMHLLLAALFAAPAHAADLILSWNYEEFADGDDLAGTDGWSSGYEADPWYGYLSSSSGRTYLADRGRWLEPDL